MPHNYDSSNEDLKIFHGSIRTKTKAAISNQSIFNLLSAKLFQYTAIIRKIKRFLFTHNYCGGCLAQW